MTRMNETHLTVFPHHAFTRLALAASLMAAVHAAPLRAQDEEAPADAPAAAADDGNRDARNKARDEAKLKAREKAKEALKDRIRENKGAPGPGTPAALDQATAAAAEAKPTESKATSESKSSDAKTGGASGVGGGKADITPCKPQTGKTWFNFEKATINEVLDQISRMKCMNFILSDSVKGKTDISIVSRAQVTVPQAYAAFLSAMEANGMALVPAGAYWKVIERKDAVKTTVPMYEMKDGVMKRVDVDDSRAGELPNSDANVTLLYEVRYANKDTVQNLMKQLMTKNGDLQNPSSNLFILTDSGSNILRILEVLDRIDVEGTSNRLNVISLDYADAQSISQKLQEIFGVADKKGAAASKGKAVTKRPDDKPGEAGGGGDEGSADEGDITSVSLEKIIADDRTNQLLVISSPRAFEKVKEVLRILDVPASNESAELKMWVVPLANADAQKAAATISSLASGAAAKRPAAAEKGGAKAKEAEKAAALFEGDVKVTADETTNALVVVASRRDFRALQSVIGQLDVRRPQVFVEAAILEVAIGQNRSFGLNAYGAVPVPFPVPGTSGQGFVIVSNEGGKQIFQDSAKVAAGAQILQQLTNSEGTANQAAAAAVADQVTSSLPNLLGTASLIGPSIDIFGNGTLTLPSTSAVVNLLQGNTDVDILSTPHIMTTDNEKAELSVGQRVPVVRGIAPVGGAGSLGFGGLQQVAYEDVKLKFTLTPHVNSNGEVRIELEQEVNDIGGQVSVGNGLTQPIITNRSVKNTVVAKDQQTITIAGLIQDRKGSTESKIPFFGDIPIIGWLFKNWSDNKQKSNLLIILTPYIVRDEEDFRKIYERKMNERRQFIDAYFSDARVYNPYLDYDKKNGPVAALLKAVQWEMEAVENGGQGHGEELIGPDAAGLKARSIGGDHAPGESHDGDHAVENAAPEAPAPEAPAQEAPAPEPTPAPAPEGTE